MDIDVDDDAVRAEAEEPQVSSGRGGGRRPRAKARGRGSQGAQTADNAVAVPKAKGEAKRAACRRNNKRPSLTCRSCDEIKCEADFSFTGVDCNVCAISRTNTYTTIKLSHYLLYFFLSTDHIQNFETE